MFPNKIKAPEWRCPYMQIPWLLESSNFLTGSDFFNRNHQSN